MSVFEVLAKTEDQEQERLASTRAIIAAQERAKSRFGSFVALGDCKCDECQKDRGEDKPPRHSSVDARLELIDDEIRAIANEVSEEYDAGDPEKVYLAATAILGGGHKDGCDCGFCKNKGKGFGTKDDDSEDKSDSDDSDDSEDSDDDKEESKKPWESSVKTACGCGCSHEGCDCGDDCKGDCHGKKSASADLWRVLAAASTWDWSDPASPDRIMGPNGEGAGREATTPCPNCGGRLYAFGRDERECLDCGLNENGQPGRWGGQQRSAAWITADVETGDNYQQETVSLPTADESGLGSEGSPKIDKGKSGDHEGWSLDPIDVDSVRNKLEKQDITDGPDLKDPDFTRDKSSPTHTDADITEAASPPDTDGTKTWTGTEGLAEPVTSARVGKWSVVV